MYTTSGNIKLILQSRITEFLGKPFIITGISELEFCPGKDYTVIGTMKRYGTTVNVKVSVDKESDMPTFWSITDDSITLKSQIIGEITFGREVYVSDPCYERGIWCATVLKNVKPGKWEARASIDTIDSWGERCYVLELFHEDTAQNETLDWEDRFALGVDSGTMSVFNEIYYQADPYSRNESEETVKERFIDKCYNLLDDKKAEIYEYGNEAVGVVCSSGVGDGCYTLYTVEENGEVIAMRINFM